MTPERYQRITSVLSKRQPDLTVVTDEVHKWRNISAVIRTCDAVGVGHIHCVVPEEGYQTYSGTAASADKWVNVSYHNTISTPIDQLRQDGFQLIAAHLCESAVDFREIDYCKPTALVLGAEIKGVSPFAEGCVDHNVVVPMQGMVESFNVSVACAVILMEAQRQRDQAGFYDSVRLNEPAYNEQFFRWAHPTLTEFCDRNKIPYPPLREDGEVEDLSNWYKRVSEKAVASKNRGE